MKIKLGFLTILMFATVLIANAQGGMRRTPEERTKRVVDTVTTVFKLEANQVAQAQTAFMDYYKESDKLRESMQGGTPPDRSVFEKLTSDRDEKLKKIFTEDQFKKFKADIEPALRTRRQQQ
jgi:thiamine biosynthesis lipoprotein ApbE